MQPARRYQPDAIIQRLPSTLANQIAAGEVVERPASIVKELVENALDAGASRIEVQIRNGGLEQIQVSDDGYGIRAEELELAVSPHATSKIARLDDLENLASLGFRGEALASIGSVARLVIDSRFSDADEAWRLSLTDRETGPQRGPVAHPEGTTVSVSELFYNTPARRRFLRTERTEYRYIEDMLKRLALSRFEVGFSLRHNQREVFRLPPATTAAQHARRVERLCGKAFYAQALHIDYSLDGLRLWGWLGRPEAARS
ncbi:MAG: DNA mismatch repair endonuclease MutL, partial [Pseudomonadota bacterium]|nr:DNA mismatch repair endonuclease MutL [Pseudomonadota bacterium]